MATFEEQAQDPTTDPNTLFELSGTCPAFVARNPNAPIHLLSDLRFMKRWLPYIEANPVWSLYALEEPLMWRTFVRLNMDMYRVLPLLERVPKLYSLVTEQLNVLEQGARGLLSDEEFRTKAKEASQLLMRWWITNKDYSVRKGFYNAGWTALKSNIDDAAYQAASAVKSLHGENAYLEEVHWQANRIKQLYQANDLSYAGQEWRSYV